MTDGAGFGVALAFGAGLLSVLSPCVLPLIPSYLTFITGLTTVDDVRSSRRATLVHALLFVLGFTLIFMALGAGATTLGRVLLSQRIWLSRVGGLLVIVFGLVLLGVIRLDALQQDRRLHLSEKPVGYLGTVLVGIAFGAGWSPCIGPILGAILTYTASEADLQRGLLLLFTYSMGLAVPFVLAAVAVERFLGVFGTLRSRMGLVNKVAGVLLIGVGVLMLFNAFAVLSAWLQPLTPEWVRARL